MAKSIHSRKRDRSLHIRLSESTARKRPSTLRAQLERAAAGLLYTSESDYPFKFFSLPAEGERDLTPEGFVARLGVSQQFIDQFNVPLDKLVQERPLDGFFPSAADLAGHYGRDPDDPQVVTEAKRFQKLAALLKKKLRGVKVLRLGSVEIRCYIVGLAGRGDLAGLVTTSIET